MSELRWIVLIQKSPKGPFTTAELESLITQGLVRRNDVAFQVLEGSTKAHSGWKFIWQFEEFNRRSGKEGVTRPHEPEQERRTAPRVAPSISEEIAKIQPDDLLFKTRREIVPREEEPAPRKSPSRMPLGWLFGGTGLAVLAVYIFWGTAPILKKERLPSSVQSMLPKPSTIRVPAAKIEPEAAQLKVPASVVKEESKPELPEAPVEVIKRDSGSRDRDERDLDRESDSEDDEPVIVKKKRKKPTVVVEEDEEFSQDAPLEEEE